MAEITMPGMLLDGTHAARPAATTVGGGTLYACSDHGLIYQSDGAAWSTWATLGTVGGIAATIVDAKGDIITATAADTPVRKAAGANDTILMADSGQSDGLKWAASQTPVDQDYDDAAAEGTADTYARGDHRHGMPAEGGGGGSDWTTVTKSADEDVASSTALQDDNHLFTPAITAGKTIIWEAVINYSSPIGGATPDLKLSFGEDGTARGFWESLGRGTGGTVGQQQNQSLLGSNAAFNTDVGKQPVLCRGVHIGNGGAFKCQWAQNVSDANATRVHSGSILRYDQID